MSHVANVFSPPGTPVQERTVGELVAERPGRSRVFQRLGMDFCCQGQKTLKEACLKKGLDVAYVEDLLAKEAKSPAPSERNPADFPLAELCRYIVDTHHAFMKKELPRLYAMSQRVAQVHGGHTPSLVKVLEVFTDMANELDDHMRKEEELLFPAIESIIRGEGYCIGTLGGPIDCMLHEHEDAGSALARLGELTDGFIAPESACNTYRALFAGLKDLEADLHRHIHLENSVLFPQALAMRA